MQKRYRRWDIKQALSVIGEDGETIATKTALAYTMDRTSKNYINFEGNIKEILVNLKLMRP